MKFPFFITAADYHEFDPAQTVLRLLNPDITVEEISAHEFFEPDDMFDDSGIPTYLAIVYKKNRPSDATIKRMLKKVGDDEDDRVFDISG